MPKAKGAYFVLTTEKEPYCRKFTTYQSIKQVWENRVVNINENTELNGIKLGYYVFMVDQTDGFRVVTRPLHYYIWYSYPPSITIIYSIQISITITLYLLVSKLR